MKSTSVSVLALILFSFSFANAQGTVSLTIESTLSGEDEKKVVELPKIQSYDDGRFHSKVPVPFGDGYWVCEVNKSSNSDNIDVSLTDPRAIQQGKEGSVYPLIVFSADIPVVWNEPMTVLKIGERSLSIRLTRVDPPNKGTKEGDVPAEILKQLDSSLSYDKKNRRIRGEFYNPTQYRFTQFEIQIIIPKSESFPGLDRLYQLNNSSNNVLNPISEAFYTRNINIPDFQKDTKPTITLKSATGRIVK